MFQTNFWKRVLLVAFASGLFCATLAVAEEGNSRDATRAKMKELTKNAKTTKLVNKAEEGAVEVDLFKAIEDGDIAAGVVQNGMSKGKLFIQNKTDKPLSVRIPDAFGTRPVLAQMAGGGMGGGMGGTDTEQLFGNSGSLQQGGNFMNVPAEKISAVEYKSVCLEYGKPVPTSRSVYELASIDEVTAKEDVKILCTMLGQVDLRAAQFAAWHLNSGVPAEKLASETVLRANGKRVTNFSKQEVQWGMNLVRHVQAAAEQAKTGQTATEEDKMFQNYTPGG